MSLSKRISQISNNITDVYIRFFRKDLKEFKNLIAKMRQDCPNASIIDCIEGYNSALEKLILRTNELRLGEIYRYIALESLLNSRDCNSIIHSMNIGIDLRNLEISYNGNLHHDYISLIKSYYYQKFVTELR